MTSVAERSTTFRFMVSSLPKMWTTRSRLPSALTERFLASRIRTPSVLGLMCSKAVWDRTSFSIKLGVQYDWELSRKLTRKTYVRITVVATSHDKDSVKFKNFLTRRHGSWRIPSSWLPTNVDWAGVEDQGRSRDDTSESFEWGFAGHSRLSRKHSDCFISNVGEWRNHKSRFQFFDLVCWTAVVTLATTLGSTGLRALLYNVGGRRALSSVPSFSSFSTTEGYALNFKVHRNCDGSHEDGQVANRFIWGQVQSFVGSCRREGFAFRATVTIFSLLEFIKHWWFVSYLYVKSAVYGKVFAVNGLFKRLTLPVGVSGMVNRDWSVIVVVVKTLGSRIVVWF